jgi:hypothetical protein
MFVVEALAVGRDVVYELVVLVQLVMMQKPPADAQGLYHCERHSAHFAVLEVALANEIVEPRQPATFVDSTKSARRV